MAKNNFLSVIIGVLITVLQGFVPLMTKELRDMIITWLKAGKKKADETPNMWDNLLMDFLCELFQVED